jgi:hypothetical protein
LTPGLGQSHFTGENPMKERPILFKAEMIRAILEGRKTQTRRVVKFPNVHFFKGPTGQVQQHYEYKVVYPMPLGGFVFWDSDPGKDFSDYVYSNSKEGGFISPYGIPGDQLWVRESYSRYLYHPGCWYWADGNEAAHDAEKPRPSIFMFRELSRIQLEVTNVRIERVQAISDIDAIAEGIDVTAATTGIGPLSYAQYEYKALWDDINIKRGFGWDVNPWVWVIEFRVMQDTSRDISHL